MPLRQALLAILALASALVASAQSDAPPAEHYTRPPAISDVTISPSGKRVAFLTTADNGRSVAAVLNLPVQGPAKVVAGFGDADVATVAWVNDDRLVLEASQDGALVGENGAGTMAVDHDGGNARPLIAWRSDNWSTGTRLTSRMLTYGWFLLGTMDDGSHDVLVHQRINEARGDRLTDNLSRLDTRTGAVRKVGSGIPDGAYAWRFDRAGEPRTVVVDDRNRRKHYWRPPGRDQWTLFADVEARSLEDFGPVALEGDRHLVVARRGAKDTSALYSFDLTAGKFDAEPLAAVAGFDSDGGYQSDAPGGSIVGVHLRADRPLSAWFDTRMAAIQAAVDAALPGRWNRLYCGRCASTNFFVVASQSDRQPGEFLLYDSAQRKLHVLGKARPWIDEAQQGSRTFHRYAARDGLPIPVYVTHPKGSTPKEPLPAVVLVHGGPWVRGSDRRWEAEAQFLASRGYRVLQPEFRGSEGYGFAHFRAGWQQWGLTMQDDLADAVQWAAAQGLVDPARVCIVGASYGGYAALMAPVRHPDRWRCAASFAGVTDIDLMFSSERSDVSERSKRYGYASLIGDPKADAAKLRQNSPLHRVADIKVPVLLAHGYHDRRVPREHYTAFVDAAQRAGVKLESVMYPGAGHGWYESREHADFLSRLEKFLAREIGSGQQR